MDGDGLVVLVVDNLESHTSEAAQDLVAAAGNTSVWVVLYPHLPTVNTSLYQDLVDATNGSLLTVINPYGPIHQSVDDLVTLSSRLHTILQETMEPHSVWKKVLHCLLKMVCQAHHLLITSTS